MSVCVCVRVCVRVGVFLRVVHNPRLVSDVSEHETLWSWGEFTFFAREAGTLLVDAYDAWLKGNQHDSKMSLCAFYNNHPQPFVHLVYFVWVDVGFYFIYLLQGSTWLIDPMWQLLPVCITAFYALHPSSSIYIASSAASDMKV